MSECNWRIDGRTPCRYVDPAVCTVWAVAKRQTWVTHARLAALRPGLPGWAGTRKVKLIWSKRQWVAVAWPEPYASLHLPPDQYPTTQFLQAGCPSCRPTNSIKALKANSGKCINNNFWVKVCTNASRVKLYSRNGKQWVETFDSLLSGYFGNTGL